MTKTALELKGTGLITGLESTVRITQNTPGSGIVFQVGEAVIPASPIAIVNTERGVTLGADGKTLSIVEHFLAACAMMNLTDLRVDVSGAPELPILDGSSQPWLTFLKEQFGEPRKPERFWALEKPVHYQDPRHAEIQLLATPAETLQITYLVNFPHPDLDHRWATWEAVKGDLMEDIAPARTFGMVSELPLLQAQGLGMGVTVENTLGLTDDGGYTSDLRFPDEPIRHKILDFIGDMMLCGVPILGLKANIVVYWGGHTAHLAFGQRLREQLPA
jgi:UDP-3-O-[3-hydroxymyristoyl] N-acetylglucosamine deacetylase